MSKITTSDIGGLPEDEKDFFYQKLSEWKEITNSESLAIRKALSELERYREEKYEGSQGRN